MIYQLATDMALAPAVRLLLPVPSVEQQHAPPAATSFSPASLGSATGSYTSFSLFLHPPCHRLRKGFRPAISRVTEVEEGPQQMEREPRRTPKRLAENPPWQKKASNAASGEVPQASGGVKPHSFRPAPWQQGFRERPNAPAHEAPWQQGPVDVETQTEDNEEETRRINAEADKSAMARIVEKLRTIQQTFDPGEPARTVRPSAVRTNQNVVATGKNLSTPSDHPVLELDGEVLNSKFPWEKDEKAEEEKSSMQEKRVRTPTRAELTIPPHELKRLRLLGVQLQERLKIGKLGVTKSIVLSIHEQWNTCELVKVKCEGSAAMSIKKTQTDLEKKTGGLVVWRAGNVIVIYRGTATSVDKSVEGFSSQESRANVHAESPLLDHRDSGDEVVTDQKVFMGTLPTTMNVNMVSDSQDKRDYEMEVEGILEGLGPRYENWTGLRPLPVDADLLPPVIPNYRPPFRLVPFGVKPRLSDTELTNLRRLARPLAPHFVLGRNRGQHGLAAAIVKLWEKSEIAKVAVKKRVQNTNNEKMAEEIKRLTGGVLLSRDKFFITFYRGKDFLPQKVAAALTEREAMVRNLQEQEEKTREERNIAVERASGIQPSVAVIGKGALDVKPSWVYTMDIEEQNRLKREAAKVRRITLARQMERKLDVALKKKEKAERDRQKVEVSLKPIERPTDTETITEEERFMFRRLGLRMKAYLLLGRRGVFDGVVENMHLHWKHRELVKILVKERDRLHLQDTARMLEYESGGVLVAVVPTAKGQAIIMYRGKNYQRPAELRPRNLLTKRKALKRSLEMQRHASLSKHIQDLEEEILKIRADLRKMGQADDDELNEGFGNEYGDSSLEAEADADELNEGFGNEYGDSSLEAESDGVLEYEQREEPLTIEDKDTGSTLSEEEMDQKIFQEKIKRLERLVRLGPIYRADPLTNTERLRLRKEALSLSKASQFHVGKSNALEGLARGIRIYFLYHALVKIVVKGRGQGTSIQDLVHDLEDLTGGVLVSQEASKIIMYRGWPEGDEMPRSESLDDLSAELCDALEAEEDWDDDLVEDYMAGGEVDASDDEELETEDYISGKDDDVLDDDDEEGGDQDSSWDLQLELNDSSGDGEDDAEDDFNFEMLLDGSEDEACVDGSKRDTRSVFKGEAEEMW